MKINVPYFRQDTNYSCGPASLQMLFAFYGKRFSEEKLMKELETSKDTGTSHSALVTFSTEEGFYVYVNNNSDIAEIREFIQAGFPVLVHFIETSDNEGHYSIITEINSDVVILNDPWNGEGFEISLPTFMRRWHSEDMQFQNWLMVLSEEKFTLGKQYLPA